MQTDLFTVMAQNINPLYSLQTTPTKNSEERKNTSQDNHAVTKRYIAFRTKIDRENEDLKKLRSNIISLHGVLRLLQ